jgi:predicted PurR-regulated permease PerM
MQNVNADNLYKTITKGLLYAALLIILLWFAFKIVDVILLILFAVILALIINVPVAWLEKRKIRRGWACVIVFALITIGIALLCWLIVPKISVELTALINNLPGYADQLSKNIASWFSSNPKLSREIEDEGNILAQLISTLPDTLVSVGSFSLSLISSLLIFIIFISMVIYAVIKPRPLLQIYFSMFAPEKRDKAKNALHKTAVMLNGWIKSNLIGGTIDAACVTAFLSIMNVPGAWVWGALTFFAELIPKIGFYIMAIPPILVALSINPLTALWVTIFFLVLDEIMGDFVLPRIRSSTMNLHPVSTIVVLLIMGSAFGLIGALLATPLTAIMKAYYEEFYLAHVKNDKQMEERIDAIIYHTNDKRGTETK